MRYYTAKGDGGTTKLFNCPAGARMSKGEEVFEVLGGLDELNSFVGLSRAVAARTGFRCLDAGGRSDFLQTLSGIQQNLFIIQAELAGAAPRLSEEKVTDIEERIERLSTKFPPITSFVIPGATELGSLLDICRTIARRVERSYVKARPEGTDSNIGRYVNRLSSAFYVLARCATHCQEVEEQAPTYR
ncbi:MAG: cob(I)yrinic acid a,c-diamide adenosyltransferase [bacterium]|nr:cob(I)yrinic acid a,c-diamide adenosyltransferase [bacterium]